jgi:hypothetical protein
MHCISDVTIDCTRNAGISNFSHVEVQRDFSVKYLWPSGLYFQQRGLEEIPNLNYPQTWLNLVMSLTTEIIHQKPEHQGKL